MLSTSHYVYCIHKFRAGILKYSASRLNGRIMEAGHLSAAEERARHQNQRSIPSDASEETKTV